jgi:hypothetical protein
MRHRQRHGDARRPDKRDPAEVPPEVQRKCYDDYRSRPSKTPGRSMNGMALKRLWPIFLFSQLPDISPDQ